MKMFTLTIRVVRFVNGGYVLLLFTLYCLLLLLCRFDGVGEFGFGFVVWIFCLWFWMSTCLLVV